MCALHSLGHIQPAVPGRGHVCDPKWRSSSSRHQGTRLIFMLIAGSALGTTSDRALCSDVETNPSSLAAQVMNAQYAYVGLQEYRKLYRTQNMERKTQRDAQDQSSSHNGMTVHAASLGDARSSLHIVQPIATFYYGAHFCIAMELLHENLLGLLDFHRSKGGMC